jgi:hypothetical protein
MRRMEMEKYSIWKDEATNTYEVVRWINNKSPVIVKSGLATRGEALRFIDKEKSQ